MHRREREQKEEKQLLFMRKGLVYVFGNILILKYFTFSVTSLKTCVIKWQVWSIFNLNLL
jgi:hypothetical protein